MQQIDLRTIPPKRRRPDHTDQKVTYAIPARITKVHPSNQDIVPILIEHLDFRTGRTITSDAISEMGTLQLFQGVKLPITTFAIAYKDKGYVRFKVTGSHMGEALQRSLDIPEVIATDEETLDRYVKHYYREINEWAEGIFDGDRLSE